jgi:cystathionine beta-synthase
VLDRSEAHARHIAGILDEWDILHAVSQDQEVFRKPVRDFMSSRLETVAPTTPVADLVPIFDKGMVAIVVEDGRFLGLITRIDVLNYLRRKLP